MSILSEKKVAIVGLGLMGGSLAMALRPHVSELVAIDRDEPTLAAALRRGLVDSVSADPAAGLQQADLVVLATPVRSIRRLVALLPEWCPASCAVIDLGSTKVEICEAMAGLPDGFEAIGGHPMCGKETAGLSAADPDLYLGRTFVLCPNTRTTPGVRRLALELVEVLGGRPLFLSPQTHDELVAVTSHVPYVLAAALMFEAAEEASMNENIWSVSSSGFRDMTRLAGSNPTMMLDILMTNRQAVTAQLGELQEMIGQIGLWLQEGDERALSSWVEAAHRAYLTKKGQEPG
jgi:prephenate dehydrogenase